MFPRVRHSAALAVLSYDVTVWLAWVQVFIYSSGIYLIGQDNLSVSYSWRFQVILIHM